MASGWRFSVTVPSWTQTTLEGDELVVFYRVEVKVIPPDSNAQPRCRSVLRRFSHFTKLHNKLREELGPKKMAGKDAPAKRSLFNVNRKPDLIERRRRELQQWLWRLIGDPDVARSKMLNDFLELSDAARLVQRPPNIAKAGTESVAEGSYAMSEGSSPRGDASSEASGFTSASVFAPSVHGPSPMPSADFEANLDRFVPGASTSAQAMDRLGPLPATEPASLAVMDGDVRQDEVGNLRLGLRMEQRGNVKRLVRTLKQRLDRASSDLQDAIATLQAERDAKRRMAEQVAALEARMGVDHTQREAELDRLLDQVAQIDSLIGPAALWQERRAAEELRASLDQSLAHNDALSSQLLAQQRSPASAAAEADTKSLPVETAAGTAASEDTAAALQERIEQAADALRREQEALQHAEVAETARDAAAAGAAAAKQQAEEALEQLAAAKTKAKADLKLLAKEVKSLRKQLAELEPSQAELEQAQAALATARAEASTASETQQHLSDQVAAAQAELSQARSLEQQLQAEIAALRAEKKQLLVEQTSHIDAREQQLQEEISAFKASQDQQMNQAGAREQQLQKEMSALKASQDQQMSEASAKEQQLQEEISALIASQERSHTAISQLRAESSQADARDQQLQEKLSGLNASQEQESHTAISQLEAELSQMRMTLEQVSAAKQQMEDTASSERQSRAELAAALDEMLEKQGAQARTQVAALEEAASREQNLEAEVASLHGQLRHGRETLQEAEEAKSVLKAGAEETQARIAALQAELQANADLAQEERRMAVERFEAELDALRAELQQVKKALAQAHAAHAKLEEEGPHTELAALQAELQQIETEHSLGESNKLTEAMAAAQRAQKGGQEAAAECSALKAELQGVQAELKEKAGNGKELSEAQVALAEAHAHVEQLQEELDQARKDLAWLRGQLLAGGSEMHNIRKELDQTRERLMQDEPLAAETSDRSNQDRAPLESTADLEVPDDAHSQSDSSHSWPATTSELTNLSTSSTVGNSQAQHASTVMPVYDISQEQSELASTSPHADAPASQSSPQGSQTAQPTENTLSADPKDPFLPMDQLPSLSSPELPTGPSADRTVQGVTDTPGQPADPFLPMPQTSFASASFGSSVLQNEGSDPSPSQVDLDFLGDKPHLSTIAAQDSGEASLGGLSPMSSSGVLDTGGLDLMSADLLSSAVAAPAAPETSAPNRQAPVGRAAALQPNTAQQPDMSTSSNGVKSLHAASVPQTGHPIPAQQSGSGLLGRFISPGAGNNAPATAPAPSSPSPPGAMGSLMSKIGFGIPAAPARPPGNPSNTQPTLPGAGQGSKANIRPRAPGHGPRTAANPGRPRPSTQSGQVQRGPGSPKPRPAAGQAGDLKATAAPGEGAQKPEDGGWNLAGGRLESFARGLMRKSGGS